MITYRLNVKRKRKQEAYEKVSIVEKSTEPSTQKEPMSALAYIGALALIAITIIDGIPGDEAVAMGALLTMP